MKLIILDRDGVINHDSDNYIKSSEEWVPLPGSIAAIAQLSQAGYTVVIATNQSGLSRGLFGIDELENMHRKMCQLVDDAGGHIEGVFYCPHKPEDHCHCRKPAPGLFEAIEAEFQTSLEGIPAIGDSIRDLQASLVPGCTPILVRTGKGAHSEQLLHDKSSELPSNIAVFNDLASAVTHLLAPSEKL